MKKIMLAAFVLSLGFGAEVFARGCDDFRCDECEHECCNLYPGIDCAFGCNSCKLFCQTTGYWPDYCFWQPPVPNCSDYAAECRKSRTPQYCDNCYSECTDQIPPTWTCPTPGPLQHRSAPISGRSGAHPPPLNDFQR